jgi:endonuclease/exonuclease/phosphatase family metal-dependent hydrolase
VPTLPPRAPGRDSPAPVAGEPPQEAAVFRLATLNVLGDSHTTAHGNKPGYASGTERLPRAVQVLTDKGVDLVGFQELEAPQYQAFQRVTGGSWGVFPALTMGRNPVRNSIAWRRDTWSLVSSGTIPVPYFRGNRVPMPWVLLEHAGTHRRLAVINIHNPVSSARRGDNERWRDLGTALEVGLVNRLKAATPVVLMGDFNERDEAFCTVTSGAGMHAANGGTSAPCRPPAGAGIDWIFATPGVSFSAYERFTSSLLRSATDHPLIVATATISG